MGPELHAVTVNATDIGSQRVELDGEDISRHLAAVHIECRAQRPAQVVLELTERHAPVFEGLAEVMIGQAPDPGPAAAAFLSAIDPEELQRAALEREDLGDGPAATTEAILRQLQEWALGGA